MGGAIAGLVIGLVIAFKKTLSVPLILAYALVEGLFIGAVSQYFELAFDEPGTPAFQGIVAQAVLATLATFAGMFLAYRIGLIKVTAQVPPGDDDDALRLRDLRGRQLRLRGRSRTPSSASAAPARSASASRSSPSAWRRSRWRWTSTAIEYAIRTGAPQKYSWLLAHGLIVTLVWLYLEFLRLLAACAVTGGADADDAGTGQPVPASSSVDPVRRGRPHRARAHPSPVERARASPGRGRGAGGPGRARRARAAIRRR